MNNSQPQLILLHFTILEKLIFNTEAQILVALTGVVYKKY